MQNRILFFAHYNEYDTIHNDIYYLLEGVRNIYNRIVLVSNSVIPEEHLLKLEKLCDSIIIRANRGYDFGAWKEALAKESWEELSQYDSVTLMNDSCFGPMFDLENIYIKMQQTNVDFWGLTIHQECKHLPYLASSVPEHIESYFLCFHKNVILSSVFQKSWSQVACMLFIDVKASYDKSRIYKCVMLLRKIAQKTGALFFLRALLVARRRLLKNKRGKG